MTIWRRVGLTLVLMAGCLVLIFWRNILPFPFIALTILYAVANYFVGVRKITSRWAPLLIAMIAVPMGSFLYLSHNSVWYWITQMLSLLMGAGISLLVFPFSDVKTARS